MIRAILLDDNESHLSLMEEELKTYSKIIEVIGAYTKWHEAIPEIMASKPDVLFLDVEMPGKTGFEVAATVKDICSNVIYVTDYMKYAPQSYSVNAIFFIDKGEIEDFLAEAIVKLVAKLNERGKYKSPTTNTPEIRKIIIKEFPQIEILLFNGKTETLCPIKLEKKNYKTLRIFAEVQKGISKDIKTSYINQIEHREIFTNLHKYKSDFVEEVNQKIAAPNIKLTIDNFFVTTNRGQHTLAISSDKVDLQTRS